jgi:hypothetical protein
MTSAGRPARDKTLTQDLNWLCVVLYVLVNWAASSGCPPSLTRLILDGSCLHVLSSFQRAEQPPRARGARWRVPRRQGNLLTLSMLQEAVNKYFGLREHFFRPGPPPSASSHGRRYIRSPWGRSRGPQSPTESDSSGTCQYRSGSPQCQLPFRRTAARPRRAVQQRGLRIL